jgi:FAD synthase
VKIEFIKWLRPERKFNSKDDLINQLENDKKEIIKLSKTY